MSPTKYSMSPTKYIYLVGARNYLGFYRLLSTFDFLRRHFEPKKYLVGEQKAEKDQPVGEQQSRRAAEQETEIL